MIELSAFDQESLLVGIYPELIKFRENAGAHGIRCCLIITVSEYKLIL